MANRWNVEAEFGQVRHVLSIFSKALSTSGRATTPHKNENQFRAAEGIGTFDASPSPANPTGSYARPGFL